MSVYRRKNFKIFFCFCAPPIIIDVINHFRKNFFFLSVISLAVPQVGLVVLQISSHTLHTQIFKGGHKGPVTHPIHCNKLYFFCDLTLDCIPEHITGSLKICCVIGQMNSSGVSVDDDSFDSATSKSRLSSSVNETNSH